MTRYVDGYVIPLPKARVEDYRRMAELGARVWREHGALEYVECLADDVPQGQHTSFPMSVKLEPDETVVFSWIVFRSREHRDEVNASAMSDPRLSAMGPDAMPFDGRRMIFGGFRTIVEA
jgi:uncharacterized protein YbaA (DUF1428 family)